MLKNDFENQNFEISQNIVWTKTLSGDRSPLFDTSDDKIKGKFGKEPWEIMHNTVKPFVEFHIQG